MQIFYKPFSFYIKAKKNKKLCLFFDFFWTSHFQDFYSPITLFLRYLESSNFLTRCEYIERKTPSKIILEFLKHFSSRSHHKLYFGPPCICHCFFFLIHPRENGQNSNKNTCSIGQKSTNRKGIYISWKKV